MNSNVDCLFLGTKQLDQLEQLQILWNCSQKKRRSGWHRRQKGIQRRVQESPNCPQASQIYCYEDNEIRSSQVSSQIAHFAQDQQVQSRPYQGINIFHSKFHFQ